MQCVKKDKLGNKPMQTLDMKWKLGRIWQK